MHGDIRGNERTNGEDAMMIESAGVGSVHGKEAVQARITNWSSKNPFIRIILYLKHLTTLFVSYCILNMEIVSCVI